ncbi:hypothetical protein [Nonomuraea sp. B5E05]
MPICGAARIAAPRCTMPAARIRSLAVRNATEGWSSLSRARKRCSSR